MEVQLLLRIETLARVAVAWLLLEGGIMRPQVWGVFGAQSWQRGPPGLPVHLPLICKRQGKHCWQHACSRLLGQAARAVARHTTLDPSTSCWDGQGGKC